MPYQVLIPEDVDAKGKDFLAGRGYTVKMGRGAGEDDIRADVADCDAILVRNARYTRRIMEAGKRLKVIARHGTGVDNIDLDAASELGIQVVNTPTANIDAVAEYTVAMIGALSCDVFANDRATRAGDWQYRLRQRRRELSGLTLGVIGFGRVGRNVARRAVAGFGMRVLAHDKFASADDIPQGVELVPTLHSVLRNADIVTLHAPATQETRGLMRKETLAVMKPTAYLVNCARGELCVEADLVEALSAGTIAGAALDVFSREPLPEDHPLLGRENVILSQHCAGLSVDAQRLMSYYAAVGIDEVLSGATPTWPANRPLAAK